MISVRPITPQEWSTYRDLRLRALRDAPDAFGSTYAAEVSRTDEAWAERIAGATSSGKDQVFFALHGDQACGLVWCQQSAAEPGMADLYQMWVAPEARGLGAGQALLQAALAWARQTGMRHVRLGVTAADSPAMRLYRSQGFVPAGPLAPLREDSPLMAQAMALKLG
ncbi:GNAT family N-acetyltransferase [Acidovorax sp. Be4]|uniref:GNAT family N-acetyltransferase n=1 Tax=Acidovorax bellezanensis TaxID=2976702 RepID=A0ABT2PN65_9BURK|nr:GNAT family N-acetyltransferase [Acidovorax sp. Be4]MCT9811914.1 GNAT family N-acetyltransferase [Acidovorax sp. Be4]